MVLDGNLKSLFLKVDLVVNFISSLNSFVEVISLVVASKSGSPPLMELYPLNVSWSGGVNFNDAAAIVAKKGITLDILFMSEVNNNGTIPIRNIRVIPKGSTNALGISGNVSPLQIKGIAFLPKSL